MIVIVLFSFLYLIFIIIVPPAVDMFNVTNGTQSDTTIEVVVEWEEVEFDVVCV